MKLKRVKQHVRLGTPIIDDNRQLDHVFLFEFACVHDGDDVAVALGRGGQIQHEERIQIVQHLDAQITLGVVAFIDDDDRGELVDDLNQRGFIDAGNERIAIRIMGNELREVAVLLINLAPFLARDPQRIVGQNEDGEILPHAGRGKRLPVQPLRTVVDLDARAEIEVDLLAIRVLRIAKVGDGLFQNRGGGNEPHDGFGIQCAYAVEDVLDGSTRQKRLSAARRHLEADMGHAGQHVVIWRQCIVSQADGDTEFMPVFIVGCIQVFRAVQKGDIRIQFVKDALLIILEFHAAPPLQRRDIAAL